ncbi:MAG: pyridoxamine 5'-phosphate oxidase family protein [Candidatus Rokubacteria bacterium]|nr:pyridoxamine 5'-phosphate oxidase family protein [Candidatus Rokubacteria bacterium]
MGALPDEIKPAMQGVIPSHVVTCSGDGTPNASAISQVYYVDPDHVALSHQFFNKTVRNVAENPRAVVWLISPETFDAWDLELEYDHAETSGPVFEALDMQIEAIASIVGLKGIFKLRSADIYRVISATKNVGERVPLPEIAEPTGRR